MKDIVAAIMLAAASLQGQGQPDSALDSLGGILLHSQYSVAIGYCAQLPPGGASEDILFGAYTTAPPGVNGFVNIGNKWCGLRSTGETLPCPPPVPEPCNTH